MEVLDGALVEFFRGSDVFVEFFGGFVVCGMDSCYFGFCGVGEFFECDDVFREEFLDLFLVFAFGIFGICISISS